MKTVDLQSLDKALVGTKLHRIPINQRWTTNGTCTIQVDRVYATRNKLSPYTIMVEGHVVSGLNNLRDSRSVIPAKVVICLGAAMLNNPKTKIPAFYKKMLKDYGQSV